MPQLSQLQPLLPVGARTLPEYQGCLREGRTLCRRLCQPHALSPHPRKELRAPPICRRTLSMLKSLIPDIKKVHSLLIINLHHVQTKVADEL